MECMTAIVGVCRLNPQKGLALDSTSAARPYAFWAFASGREGVSLFCESGAILRARRVIPALRSR